MPQKWQYFEAPFRHLLEEHQIAEQILESVNQRLSEKGVMLKEGKILDATIIKVASRQVV